MHPSTDQTLLFILEHVRLVIFILVVGIELFSFVANILVVSDGDAFDVPALLGLTECLPVELNILVVCLGEFQFVYPLPAIHVWKWETECKPVGGVICERVCEFYLIIVTAVHN